MPPKPKTVGNTGAARPAISTSSLVHVPDNAVFGFQDRIETGIDWSLAEQASKAHQSRFENKIQPKISFKDALINKIQSSICREFLDKNTRLSLNESWELSLPITLWDIDKFGDDTALLCFKSHNSVTDNLADVIRLAVKHDNRNVIMKELRNVPLLRVIGCKMTHLDQSLSEYRNLNTLNLCCNYLSRIEAEYLPDGIQVLELNSNRIPCLSAFSGNLPKHLVYLGLGRNLLNNVCPDAVSMLRNITVLDLSDNDIYELDLVLEELSKLPKLCSLSLVGNPCSVCAAYAIRTIEKLPNLLWLDNHPVFDEDRPKFPLELHPDDLRSSRFVFTVLRVISVPPPPKVEKGVTITFHVELEIPLLDSKRRQFLMNRRHESLIELCQSSEDLASSSVRSYSEKTKSDILTVVQSKISSEESDVYTKLITKNSNEIINYTIFESNKVQWNKMMTFQHPTIKIFCPDLRALRDTFRSEITIRLICTMSYASKQGKANKKSSHNLKASDQYCVLAEIKCKLSNPDWTRNQQYFQWDDQTESVYAENYENDLSAVQYSQNVATKTPKSKSEGSESITKRQMPENLTCHFGFGIETVKA